MPKYWGKQIFTHARFLKVGQKQKTEREKKKKKKKERESDNNGQVMHGARKHAWRMQAAWDKIDTGGWPMAMTSGDCSIPLLIPDLLQ